MSTVLIAQVTDTHLLDPARGAGPYVDHVARLAEAVRRINAEDPAVDLVVLTGDLTEDGDEAANRLLVEVLQDLVAPVVGVPGNHDHRSTFPRRLLPGGGCTTEHLSWTIDAGEVRVVGLDTTIPGEAGGTLDADRAEWLEATLARAPQQPTLVAMHHPPFDTGIGWMDAAGHPGAELRSILARHPQVQRVIAGHLHRPVQTVFDHALVSVAPSTVHHVALDLAPAARPRLVLDPVGYQLHRWHDGTWVTHTRYLVTGHEPFTPSWG